MIDRLEWMFNAQRALQEDYLNVNLRDQSDEERITHIKENAFALIAELYEAINEIGWKSWATSRHINRNQFVAELVDVWHFLMNLMLHVGIDADEFMKLYQAKNEINVQRHTDGYDGLSGKCSYCHRDLLDADIREVVATSTQRVDIHCMCGAYLGSQPV